MTLEIGYGKGNLNIVGGFLQQIELDFNVWIFQARGNELWQSYKL